MGKDWRGQMDMLRFSGGDAMKATVRINEYADIKPLALAVVSQAIRDLREADTMSALDAAMWLTGDNFGLWADAMGIPFADGYKLLISGRARTMKVGKR
jgi:hypothetical protein